MLRHYFALALRNARRAPVASVVNAVTLAIGLAAFLTAYAFVAFWARAEQHFANADRTYVLTTSFEFFSSNFRRTNITDTPRQMAELLATDFPLLESVARAIVMDRETPVASGDRAARVFGVAVDPEFLDIFDLPFVIGDPRSALSAPRSVVITEEYATQLFGTDEALGRSVLIGNLVDATVTGVIDAIPEPSHMARSASASLPFDLLASMDVHDELRAKLLPPFIASTVSWTGGEAVTYLLLPADGALTAERLEQQLPAFVARHVPAEQVASSALTFGLMPVRDLLRNNVDAELFSADFGVSGSALLLALGAAVLAVACLNYGNLAVARAARRAREVGVRKALGAGPWQVTQQQLAEAGVLTVAALLIAAAVFALTLPRLEALSGAPLGATLFSGGGVWIFVAGVAVAVTLAAGAYPAAALSRLDPANAIRASQSHIGRRSIAMLLVGAQFTVASALLIAVTIVSEQNAQLVRTGLGAAMGPLVLIDNRSAITKVEPETLRQELLRVPQVRAVTELSGPPWQRLVAVTALSRSPEASGPLLRTLTREVGYDFFSVMDIPLLAGRTFSRDHDDLRPFDPQSAGSQEPGPVVIDRAFATSLGYQRPADAIDTLLYYPPSFGGPGGAARPMRIVGVVETRPLNFRGVGAAGTRYSLGLQLPVTIARVDGDDIAAALAGIDTVWRRLAPNVAISRSFFDELFDRAYETFVRINAVFTALAVAAFIIAIAGLFGIATLVAGRRRREIGVRKVCGARTAQVLLMLLGSFSKPVLAANLIAWPLTYLAARRYLDVFAEPIALTPTPFVATLAVTAVIGVVAVGGQALRAARSAPAEVLRDE